MRFLSRRLIITYKQNVSNLWREKREHIDNVLFVRFFPLLFTFNIIANIIRDQIQSTGWVMVLEELFDYCCTVSGNW